MLAKIVANAGLACIIIEEGGGSVIVGGGRGITLAVMAIIFTLLLLLTVVIVMGFEEYGPRIFAFLGREQPAPVTDASHPETLPEETPLVPIPPRLPERAVPDVGVQPLPPPPGPVPPPDRALAGARATLSQNPAIWFGNADYPVEAIRKGEQGRVVARLSIDASGAPVRCTVAASSLSSSLDSTTCSILMKRARLFTPARDRNGVATVGEYTVPVRWVLPED